MPKSLKAKVGNKHKGLRSAKDKASGRYAKQSVKTVANRRRKRLKHVRDNPNDEQTKKLL